MRLSFARLSQAPISTLSRWLLKVYGGDEVEAVSEQHISDGVQTSLIAAWLCESSSQPQPELGSLMPFKEHQTTCPKKSLLHPLHLTATTIDIVLLATYSLASL